MGRSGGSQQKSKPTESEPAAKKKSPSEQPHGQIPDPSVEPEESGTPAEQEPATRTKLSSGRRSGQVTDAVPTLPRRAPYPASSENPAPDEPQQSGEHAEVEPAARSSGQHSGQVPDVVPALRRSTRRSVVSSKISDPDGSGSLPRGSKRKATSPDIEADPEELLELSLEPWKENERDKWPSWTEIESDPDMFTRILRLFGVKQAKFREVLETDANFLASLPRPVYGLIFLYEDLARDSEPEPVKHPPRDMWFARQTADDACGTVAIFNIIMNATAQGLPLGDKLERFKLECKYLTPALRGYLLSQSTWIRAAANSFSRRLDLLNAALALQEQVPQSGSKKTKTQQNNSRKQTRPSSAGPGPVYHFIAYIPFKQGVWQLDGLQKKPTDVGKYREGQHWTIAVCDVLAARMLETRASYSLMALTGLESGELEAEVDAIDSPKDHTPWIHEWVKKLADHGVLKELHEEAKKPK